MKKYFYNSRLPFTLILLLIALNVLGQKSNTYNLELVNIIDSQNQGQVFIILKVSPKVDDFNLVLSMKAKYSLGIDTLTTDIQTDGVMQLTVYGDDINDKAPSFYKIFKDNVELKKTDFLIVLRLINVRYKNLEKGFLTYGLWEGEGLSVRYEQSFYFNKDKIIIR